MKIYNKKNIFIYIIIILLIATSSPKLYGRDLYYTENNSCGADRNKIELFLNKHNIDLDTRSYRGWMRVLNNREKRIKYNLINCREFEINIIKDYIRLQKK